MLNQFTKIESPKSKAPNSKFQGNSQRNKYFLFGTLDLGLWTWDLFFANACSFSIKLFSPFLPFAFLLLSFIPAHAQQDLTLHNMSTIPQFTYTNPAFFPFSRVNIGLPVLSSIYLNASHSGFRFTDVVRKRSDDSLDIDVDNMISKMAKTNHLSLGFQTDLFSLGIRIKDKNYVSLNVTEKIFVRFTYPRDLFRLIWQGNGAFLDEGGEVSFRGIGLDATHYREYGLSWARQFTEQLAVGGRVKYLYGMDNVSTPKSDITLKTDTGTYDWTFTSDWRVNISTSLFDSTFEPDDLHYWLGLKNRGWGIDLGGSYDLNKQISFSASVNDIGFIRWRENLINLANDSASFTYSGLDVSKFIQSVQSDTIDAFQPIADSIQKTFKVKETAEPYTNWLSPQIYLTATYKINEKNGVTGTFYGEKFKKRFYPGISIATYTRLGRWLGASASYSIYNRSYFNFGAGLSLNILFVQGYIVTDNIYGFFRPDNSKNAHVRFGTILTFGRGKKDLDKDGVPDEKDECPDTKGAKEYSGCPDSDNDKIIDKFDDCPSVPGLISLKGCPDRDGDKIADKDDRCPTEAGPRANKGCPMKLHLMVGKGDTTRTVVQNEDGYFVFEKLPMDPKDLFALEKQDTTQMIHEVFALSNGNVVPLELKEDGFYHYRELPHSQVKLYMIDAKGDTIGVAELNKDSAFVFDRLPDHPNFFFALTGMEDTDVLVVAGGSVLTAKKGADNKFRFEKLPESEMTLYMLDAKGDTLMMATMNRDGFFVFDKLPPDNNVLFRLSGGDTTSLRELKIRVKGESINKLVKSSDGFFRYEKLPSEDLVNLSLLDANDVKAVLRPEEKSIISTAYTTLEFDLGSEEIRPESNRSLDQLAELMQKKPNWKLKLGGHTDNIGDENYNVLLSKSRTESVKKYLVEKGIAGDRVITRSFGEKYPIDDNNTAGGRQKNRRVEMLLVQTGDAKLYGEGGEEGKIAYSEKVIFKIQLVTSKKLKSLTSGNFKEVSPVGYYEDNGVYKYTTGNETNYDTALKIQEQARSKGFKEAFIVAFHKGKRIPIPEALEMIKK